MPEPNPALPETGNMGSALFFYFGDDPGVNGTRSRPDRLGLHRNRKCVKREVSRVSPGSLQA